MRDKLRVSMGTLRVLGLEILSTYADPKTAYLQTYHPGKCGSNCMFCAQARKSSAREEKIARGLYPERDTSLIVGRLSKAYGSGLLLRACIQTMNYPGLFDDLIYLVGEIRKASEIPISVSIYPLPKERFSELKAAGAGKLVIPLDAATPALFDRIKGKSAGCPYSWEGHISALREAIDVFGAGNVGTHLIVGLGESEEEMLSLIQTLSSMGVYSALFAFTPIPEAQFSGDQPDIRSYRRIQLASYLIEQDLSSFDSMEFRDGVLTGFGCARERLLEVIGSGLPFVTRGCPDCNRPFSTEKPGSQLFNYPLPPSPGELGVVRSQLGL